MPYRRIHSRLLRLPSAGTTLPPTTMGLANGRGRRPRASDTCPVVRELIPTSRHAALAAPTSSRRAAASIGTPERAHGFLHRGRQGQGNGKAVHERVAPLL